MRERASFRLFNGNGGCPQRRTIFPSPSPRRTHRATARHRRAGMSLLLSPFHDEVADAGMPIAASPFDWLHNPHGGKPRQQFLVEHSQFQPGQICAQATVYTLAEAQVWVRFSADVELVGAIEHAGVAVSRALPNLHLLPRFDRLSAERDIAGGGAPLRWRR